MKDGHGCVFEDAPARNRVASQLQDNRPVLAVVFGGQSSEHEISRVSAQAVLENVNHDKYAVRIIGITKSGDWLPYHGDLRLIGTGEWEQVAREQHRNSLEQRAMSPLALSDTAANCLDLLRADDNGNGMKPVDVVFPVLHGPNGEDGSIQGLFQLAGVPYVGCGILASAAGMDKTFSKVIFQQAGIPQAESMTVLRSSIEGGMDVHLRCVADRIGYPCFVKPANAGSSVGVCKVKKPEDLEAALRNAAVYDSKILVESFIDGREVECAVLGNEEPIASVVGEVIPCNEFYDYAAKYLEDRSQTIIPADLSAEMVEQVQQYSLRAFKALGASGLSRVDFFVERGTQRVVLNEINTMPGFTSISMYAKLWAASGIAYPELIDRLVELAIRRHSDTGISFEWRMEGEQK